MIFPFTNLCECNYSYNDRNTCDLDPAFKWNNLQPTEQQAGEQDFSNYPCAKSQETSLMSE